MFCRDPGSEPGRDRPAGHPRLPRAGGRGGSRVLHCRRGIAASFARRRRRAASGPPDARQSYLSIPNIVDGGQEHGVRSHPPRVRLPGRELPFRAGLRRQRHGLHRALARQHGRSGRQVSGQADHGGGRAAHHPRQRGHRGTSEEALGAGRRGGLPGDAQGLRRRRGPGDAAGGVPGPDGARTSWRPPREAEVAFNNGDALPGEGHCRHPTTSRCRSWATGTGACSP